MKARRTIFPLLLLVCVPMVNLSAAPDIVRIVPSTAEAGDQVLAVGESFGPYVRPPGGAQDGSDQQAGDTSRVVLVNIGDGGPGVLRNCPVLSWEDSRVVFTIPGDAQMTKRIGSDGFPVSDTLLFYPAGSSSPLKLPYLVIELEGLTIDNLQVINVTPTSAEVHWRSSTRGPDTLVLALGIADTLDITSDYFTNDRNYYPTFVVANSGQLTLQPSDVSLFHSDLALGNGIHQVVLTDLQPERLYQFFIVLPEGQFLADSSRMVGGPYTPVLIGRSAINHNGLLDAFSFRTLPNTYPGGMSYLLTGSVDAPVVGGRVAVFLVSATELADTSNTVGALLDFQGYWVVNLNSLRLAREPSRQFYHRQGDIICVTIDAGNQGFCRFETYRGPPEVTVQNMGRHTLQPVVNFPELICTGNNLFSVPVMHSDSRPLTAVYLLEKVSGANASLSRYLSDQGIFQTCYRSALPGDQYLGDNFILRPGEAYIFSSSHKAELIWRGAMFGRNLPEIKFPGAGLYYFSRPLQPDSLAYNWDSYSFLREVAAAKEIFTWDSRYQRYLSAFKLFSGEILGRLFALRPGGGYIARITEADSWDASIPGHALLAGRSAAQNPGPGPEEYLAVQPGDWRRMAWPEQPILCNMTANSFSLLTQSSRPDAEKTALEKETRIEVFRLAGYRLMVYSGLPPGSEIPLPSQETAVRLPQNTLPGRPDLICYGTLADSAGFPLTGRPVWIGVQGSDPLVGDALLAFSDSAGTWWVNLANLSQDVPKRSAGDDSLTLQVTTSAGESLLQTEIRLGDSFPAGLHLRLESSAQEPSSSRHEATGKKLPRALLLDQNYPNPFNPRTSIDFTVPASTDQTRRVRLEVFNLRGRRLKTLIEGNLAAGRYSVTWNGRDERNRPVGSGVYLYRLSLPETVLTRKMILLK